MTDRAERMARLSPEKRAALAAMLRERTSAPRLEPRPRSPEGDTFPLSFGQAGLLFLQRLDPGSGTLNAGLCLRLRGPLDRERLQSALDALVRRHEVLRTTFPEKAGTPVQRVAPAGSLPLRLIEQSGAAGALLEEEYRHPFDLAAGPVARASLVALGPGEHVLLLVVHHIASDAWSAALLRRDLIALYRGDPLPPVPVQFADYAVWQRQRLQGEFLDELLGFWSERLQGLVPLELPAVGPRPAAAAPAGTVHRFTVPTRLAEDVRALARSSGGTPFIVLLAGFQALLHRYTGAGDVAVGVDVSNRGLPELEPVVGCFINQVVIRAGVSPDMTAGELLAGARDAALAALAHQELPFERLLEHLRVPRAVNRNPLFQVGFRMVDQPAGGLPPPEGLEVTDWPGSFAPAHVDLAMEMTDGAAGLQGQVVYNGELFAAGFVSALTDHYLRLLEAGVTRPDTRVRDLPLLGEAERERIVQLGSGGPLRPLVEPLAGPDDVVLVYGEPAGEHPMERWSALLGGGRRVRAPAGQRLADVVALIEREGVTVLWLPGRWFHAAVDGEPGLLSLVGTVLVGGGELSRVHVRRARERFPSLRLLHVLTGPLCPVPLAVEPILDGLVVSRPLPGVRLTVRDAGGGLLPAGLPGDLWAAGEALPADWREGPTGRRARLLPGGGLEPLGDPAEGILAEHPGVREVAVPPGGTAWIVPEGAAPAEAELRRLLRTSLADHEVPSAFELADALPLTPSGGLDGEALRPARAALGERPWSPVEEQLRRMWCDILELEPDGIELGDDFFELGGHSLLAAQLIVRIRRELEVDLLMPDVFDNPTIELLAARVERDR